MLKIIAINCIVTITGSNKKSYALSKYLHLARNHFDSDSYTLQINNCCLACVLNCIEDFNCKPVQVNANINRACGAIQLAQKGTIMLSFQDNKGRPLSFLIKDLFYAPNIPCCLLSPQYWSQNAADNANQKGTWSATYFNKVEFLWSNNTYHRKTAPDPSANMAAI